MRLVDDLKRRRNLDIYATIGVAILVSVLSALEVVPDDKVTAVVLAVLAIIAFNLLATREIVAEKSGRRSPPLYDDFAPDLIQKRNASTDVYLIGVSLSRTVETSFPALSRNLRAGGKIRILLADPDASEAAIDARCQATRPEIDDIRHEIRASLAHLAKLDKVRGGALEVRTTRSALKFGLNYLDVSKATAEMHIQLYSFRLEGESRPMLILRASDGEWFDCYRHQVEDLWDDSIPVIFPARAASAPAAAPPDSG